MEMEVALEEEVALADVIGRPDRARQKRLTLIYGATCL